MENQSEFLKNIRVTYGESGQLWLDQLPSLITSLSRQWDFQFIQPLPLLSYNFVALVELTPTLEKVILKMGPPGAKIIPEAKWLQCFKSGVPKVYNIDEVHNAFLMQHLVPGTTLKTLVKNGQDVDATRIIAQTIMDLQTDQVQPSAYTPYSELARDLSFLKDHIDNEMLLKAQSLFQELSSDSNQHVLLHGDLHHDNILQCGTSWKAIDPHGYIGDPVAEIGAMFYNPYGAYPNQSIQKTIDTRFKILCEMLPFDPARMKAWAFCVTLLSSAWDVEGFGEVQQNKIEIAQTLDNLVVR